jgi:hypothetical protein
VPEETDADISGAAGRISLIIRSNLIRVTGRGLLTVCGNIQGIGITSPCEGWWTHAHGAHHVAGTRPTRKYPGTPGPARRYPGKGLLLVVETLKRPFR